MLKVILQCVAQGPHLPTLTHYARIMRESDVPEGLKL